MGVESLTERFKAAGDDYSYIMAEALADRLAEAFAEKLHELVRRRLWGYAPDEDLSVEDMLKVRYRGIRPAAGYPSQPDHTEKATMWSLMGVEEKVRSRRMCGGTRCSTTWGTLLGVCREDQDPWPSRPHGKRQVGMRLTESMAMMPAASVSGLYFASPQAQYFAVGKITQEQAADYAVRKKMPIEEAERWLRSILSYEP